MVAVGRGEQQRGVVVEQALAGQGGALRRQGPDGGEVGGLGGQGSRGAPVTDEHREPDRVRDDFLSWPDLFRATVEVARQRGQRRGQVACQFLGQAAGKQQLRNQSGL